MPVKDKFGPPKFNKPSDTTNKGKAEMQQIHLQDVKCFKCSDQRHITSQCPNRNVMVLRDNGEIDTEAEYDDESLPPLDDANEMEYVVGGELFVVKRGSNVHVLEDDEQLENIFHTRCHVEGKVCSVIIDGRSCTNVASNVMVENLVC